MRFWIKNKQKRQCKKLHNNAGFTLIEMIITVGIIAILTGLVSIGIYGYLSTAYTVRVNETAKTVFYAAQEYLLEQKQMGQLETFNKEAKKYGAEVTWDELKKILKANLGSEFNETEYEDRYATQSTAYILMEKGSVAENPLYQIVEESTKDYDLLKNTFLMEYDTKSGVVRSVFYSEQVDTFTYGGANTQENNVILRSPESLLEKKQGFYGVDITGKKAVSQVYVMDPTDVMLFNGERLYLQWTDENDTNTEFELNSDLLDALQYDVSVYRIPKEGKVWEPLFSISDIYIENKERDTTLEQADDSRETFSGYRLAYQKSTRTYQLILDDLHHSIFDTYKADGTLPANVKVIKTPEAEDILVCEVTAKLDKAATGLEAESFATPSNYQSSAFAGGEKEAVVADGSKVNLYGSGELEEGTKEKPFGIAYARHINNVRYGKNKAENANFVQTADIDWGKPENRVQTNAFATIRYDQAFAGTYEVQKKGATYHTLSNLLISQTNMQMVGLFAVNMGEINGLTLVNPKVNGSIYAGAVTGINGGSIKNVTITNGNINGSHLVGGITGYNTPIGSITNTIAESNVKGEKALTESINISEIGILPVGSKGEYIGGIAGLNKGSGNQLKAGSKNKTQIAGTAYVGGVFGSNDTEKVIEDVSNYNKIVLASNTNAVDKTECIGGIVGYQGKGDLVKASHYGSFDLKVTTKTPDSVQHIGGIAGKNIGLLKNCTNKGDAALMQTTLNDCVSKIKAGNMPSYAGKYVGGIAGSNLETGVIQNAVNDTSVTTGYQVVGGIAGKNLGQVIQSNTTGNASIVIGTDYLVGGVFGYHTGGKTENYTNKAHVFGKGMVGGIMGFNGELSTNGDETLLAYLKTLKFDGSAEYYDKLLGIETYLSPRKGGEIQNCINQGFVYAQKCFQGGIAGVNYGDIKESNVDTAASSSFKEIQESGSADCIGGIVGYNGKTGVINGRKLLAKQTAKVEIIGKSFAGGIVGINLGTIEGYGSITGSIFAKGDCVGGVIGLNTNESAILDLTVNNTKEIKGDYFVGGIIGCNVTPEEKNKTSIEGVHSDGGVIKATAYAGGILGYNAYAPSSAQLGELFTETGELTVLKKNAFTQLASDGSAVSGKTTVFKGCVNKAEVIADRYVGGIVGFNSQKSTLWIANCSNAGRIKIENKDKTQYVIENGEKVYYYYIGGITGRNSKAGVIHNCVNNGTVVSPSTYLGGICETNEGYVQFCATGTAESAGDIGGDDSNSVGGIVGLNDKGGKVVSCRADQYAKLKGGNKTGGLVGTNAEAGIITSNINGNEAKDVSAIGESHVSKGEESISYCSALIFGKNHTGGIVGYNQGQVENIKVTNKAEITGYNNVGGFIGYNAPLDAGSKMQDISGLVNYANVYGNHEVGGIIGKHAGTSIKNCTNAGRVEASGTMSSGLPSAMRGYAGGITGFVGSQMSVKDCINYGTVISNQSFAGGIAGINNGILQDNVNYGSVEGSMVASTISVTDEDAIGSAIGGITGSNMRKGKIYDCASRDRKDDPNGQKNNPYWDIENKIRGNFMVGGIIGFYERTGISSCEFQNTSDFSKEVTITIEPKNQKIAASGRCNIGGVIGSYTYTPKPETLENLIFSGKINVLSEAGKNQQDIGGILGNQHANITLKNCYFNGTISGQGNNPDANDYAGVGGLAGSSNGTIIVEPSIRDGKEVYTSTKDGSKIHAAKRVGGIVGEASATCNIVLLVGGVETPLATVNEGKAEADYLYYDNYAVVQGGKSAGGFYGAASPSSKKLIYLRNYATILTADLNGKANVGGIAGQTEANLEYCYNKASIGNNEDANITRNVGGLVGYWGGGSKKEAKNCSNDGIIYAGKENIGGLIGESNNAVLYSTCQNNTDIIVNQKRISAGVRTVGGLIGNAQNTVIGEGNTKLVTMNKPGTGIVVKGKAQNLGGIVGNVQNVTIRYIDNQMKLSEETSISANNNAAIYAGGMVGTASGGTLVLENNKNSAEILFSASSGMGGMIGLNQSTLTMTDCENVATIVGNDTIGGLIGNLYNSTLTNFRTNKNLGEIVGVSNTGGLVGYVSGSKGAIKDSVNEGLIKPQKTKNNTSAVARIGGCVGTANGASTLTLEGLINNAEISVNEVNGITTARDIGGIVGELSNGVSLNNCRNEKPINVVINNASDGFAIGGIAGSVRSAGVIGNKDSKDSRTVNAANITVTGGRANSIYEVGGIAGFVAINSKIAHAQNEGSVAADMVNSLDVGGVAGKSYGLIYSCQTTESVEVSGKSNIGGLVGRAYDYTSKITSTSTGTGAPGYDLSISNADVKGHERVGGIIGYQQEATIYNVLVTDEANITLLSTGKNENAAGGLVGYAGVMDGGKTTKGVIANCYSYATVTGTTTEQLYLGGIVGFRLHGGADAATAIVDCFAINKTVDATQPPAEKAGTVEKRAWAVGNEPLVTMDGGTTYIFKDDRDEHVAILETPLEGADKFFWSQDSYDALCVRLGITDIKPFDSKEAIEGVMQKYDGFKLPAPEMNPVRVGDSFDYTFPFRPLAGFYTKYGFKMFAEDIPIGDKVADDKAALYQQTLDIEIGDKIKEITLPLDTILSGQIKELVGKTISVATYAEGYTLADEGDGLNYTKKSDLIVKQKFVIMPPLPTPNVKALPALESDKDFFDANGRQVKVKLEIENWAEFEKAAKTVYSSLPQASDDAKLAQANLYDAFANGLFHIKMEDSFNPAKGGAIANGFKTTHTIQAKDKITAGSKEPYYEIVNEAGVNKAYITIDYSENPLFIAHNATRPWHAFTVQSITFANHLTLPINPDNGNFKYRYTNSKIAKGEDFRLKMKFLPPKDLNVEYVGGVDAAEANTPSYLLKWAKNGGNDADILGYKVELTYLKINDGTTETKFPFDTFDRAPFKRTVTGATNLSQALSKEELADILKTAGVDLTKPWWSHEAKYTLGFKVTTLAKDADVTMDSDASSEAEFELIKQQKPVKDILVEKDGSADGRKLKITWVDDDFHIAEPNRDEYEVIYQIIANAVSYEPVIQRVKESMTLSDITIPNELADAPFSVKVTIKKIGEQGLSLNSDEVLSEQLIGKRLEKPNAFTIAGDRIEVDGSGIEILHLTLTWDNTDSTGKEVIAENNCSGYSIETVLTKGGAQQAPIVTTVDGFNTKEVNLAIPITDVTAMQFNIRATGKYPIAESSEWVGISFPKMPTRLAMPEITNVKVGGKESYPIPPLPSFLTREEYGKEFSYELIVDAKDPNTNGQEIIISYEGSELIRAATTYLGVGNSYLPTIPLSALGIAQAGKEVNIALYNKSSNIQTILPSPIAKFTFRMPHIQLSQASIDGIGYKEIIEIGPPETKTYQYQAGITLLNSVPDADKADERAAISKIQVEIAKQDGTMMAFVPTNESGIPLNDGSFVTAWEIEAGSDTAMSYSFFFQTQTPITDVEKADYSLRTTVLAKGETVNKRYVNSLPIEQTFAGMAPMSAMTLPLPMEPLEPLPGEELETEEGTTEEPETEEPSTEEPSTEEPSTGEPGTPGEGTKPTDPTLPEIPVLPETPVLPEIPSKPELPVLPEEPSLSGNKVLVGSKLARMKFFRLGWFLRR